GEYGPGDESIRATPARARALKLVVTGPASTMTTRIPNGKTSRRSASENASSACLEEQYGAENGIAIFPATEETLTIVPARAFRIAAETARVPSTAPKKLTSNWRRHSSSVTSSAAPYCAYPALLTSASTRPMRAEAASTA